MSENKVITFGNDSNEAWLNPLANQACKNGDIETGDKPQAWTYNHHRIMHDGSLLVGTGTRLAGKVGLPIRFLTGEPIVEMDIIDKAALDKEIKKEQSLHILRALVD